MNTSRISGPTANGAFCALVLATALLVDFCVYVLRTFFTASVRGIIVNVGVFLIDYD